MTEEELKAHDRHIVQIASEFLSDQIKMTQEIAQFQFDRIHAAIAGVQEDVSSLKQDVAILKTDVAVLKTDVAVLKTDVTEIKDRMDNLESDMTQVKHGVTALLEDNEKHDKDISSLKKVVASPFSA